MTLNRLYNKLFCVMQWSIGFSRGSIKQMIRDKKSIGAYKWIPLDNPVKSIADPFIFKDTNGVLTLLYEDFSMIDPAKYGKIVLAKLDKEFVPIYSKEIFDSKSHTSYPFIFAENGNTYIIPETSHNCKVSGYEFDFKGGRLLNEKVIIELPLLDTTIFTHNNKYWLFATITDEQYATPGLHIYYAETLFGTYQAHKNNPVKPNSDGSRPAGNIIKVDGELFRPAQNGAQHYGESISINRITKLSENEFSEELHFKILPDKTSEFNAGVHTINSIDDIIVIDGIKMLFKPFTKMKLFIKRKLGR